MARPVETHHVLRVDGQRSVFRFHHSNALLGQKAPLLARFKVEMVIVVFVFKEQLANTKIIAVAFTRVGRDAGAEPVHLVMSQQVLGGIDIALGRQRNAALLCAEPRFVLIVQRCIRERQCTESRVAGSRGQFVPLPPRTFHCDERTGQRDMDSAEPGRRPFRDHRRCSGRRIIDAGREILYRMLSGLRLLLGLRNLPLKALQLLLQGIDLVL